VVQISAYIDAFLASWLPTGAVSALAYAQTLYTLPVSLFGMSVSAAELPVMSGALGAADEVAGILRARMNSGLRQITFLVVPSVVGFLALGDVIVAAIYQSGRFTHADVIYVWGIIAVRLSDSSPPHLGGYILPATMLCAIPAHRCVSPLFASYSPPCSATLPRCRWPRLLGIEPRWGVAGLTISAGVASWVEFTLLQRGIRRRIGQVGVPLTFLAQVWVAALVAAATARGILIAVEHRGPILLAAIVLSVYGILFLVYQLSGSFPKPRPCLHPPPPRRHEIRSLCRYRRRIQNIVR